DSIVEGLVSIIPEEVKAEARRTLEPIRAPAMKRVQESIDTTKRGRYEALIGVISTLPKIELAQMAESLVTLTSLKRHISASAETVGGPIDVALLSKGDGLIWIKRKHYFDKDLNYHFFENYFRKEEERNGN
ncbi:MAG TPA: hypothetical protein VL354_16895, partial [Spirochaetia bacterium]|nr:hypothetical protein [Spirochaetia bacterium]